MFHYCLRETFTDWMCMGYREREREREREKGICIFECVMGRELEREKFSQGEFYVKQRQGDLCFTMLHKTL